ncbi:nucleotidyltransferase domain-containing protein [Candidatus Harpocratesius sp.]
MKTIEQIRKELSGLKNKFEVVLYGSQVTGSTRPQSDYDIAIITRSRDIDVNIQIQIDVLNFYRDGYDLRVFELFPIYIQMSIIKDYFVIFGDPLEISEYFYYFYKLWRDCKHRILQ